jgi:hypothetical protein
MTLIHATATKKGRRVYYEEGYVVGKDNCNKKSAAFDQEMEEHYSNLSRDWCEEQRDPWEHLRFSKPYDVTTLALALPLSTFSVRLQFLSSESFAQRSWHVSTGMTC